MAISKNLLIMMVASLGIIIILAVAALFISGQPKLATATGYFNGLTADGHTFKILYNSSDIPYEEGDLRNPGNYSRFISPPTAEKWPVKSLHDNDYGKLDAVRLYTWSEEDGLLIRWDVGVSYGKVVKLNANLMDVEVGNYKVNNASRYITALGVDVTATTAKDIFTRYSDFFESRGGQFDFKLSVMRVKFFDWDYQDYHSLAIYKVDGPTIWYPLEPGYITEDTAIRTGDVWRNNVIVWGYYNNNSTFFSQLPETVKYPGYNGPGPVKAFYICYYSCDVDHDDTGGKNMAMATGYFNSLKVDGHTFKVLNNSSDIPYKIGNLRNPSNYSGYIYEPAAGNWPYSDNVSLDSVRLYTWSEEDGLLFRWDIGFSNDRIAKLNANLMDVGVGDYKQNNQNRSIPALGVNVTGTTVEDVFRQYPYLYENRSYLFDFKLSVIPHGRFVKWQHSIFEHWDIADMDNGIAYGIEPGYIYDEIGNTSYKHPYTNLTAWGYFTNESSYYSQFPNYNHSSTDRGFYICYYSFEGD